MSEIIRGIRKVKGFSQTQVAEALNIGIKAYHRKENEPEKFKVKELILLANFFGVEIEVFFKKELTVSAS